MTEVTGIELIIQTITTLINNLGFPIAMVVYFIWDKTRITNQLVTAINNNNVILNKLLLKLDAEDLGDIKE